MVVNNRERPALETLEKRIDCLITRMKRFDRHYGDLEERVDIVWERSISQDLRISDLEDWQELIDDEREQG